MSNVGSTFFYLRPASNDLPAAIDVDQSDPDFRRPVMLRDLPAGIAVLPRAEVRLQQLLNTQPVTNGHLTANGLALLAVEADFDEHGVSLHVGPHTD